ncbi:MAG: hypothetical protein K2I93_09255, partial [Oscillospiraceae bacterium]|nr:hypothetical protein [Oscillospiraceae bacterium]
ELLKSYTTYTTAVYTSANELYKMRLSITTDYQKQSVVTATWIDPDGDKEKTDSFTVRNGDVLTSDGQWEQESTFTDGENYWVQWGNTSVMISCRDSEGTLQEVELTYPDRTRTLQLYTKEIENPAAPEITSVEISAETYGDITRKTEVSKSGNVLVNDTAGRIGTALDIDVADSIAQYQVTLYYNEDELRWIPEENLIVLAYDPNAPIQVFVEIPDTVLNTEHNTITFNGDRDCYYILTDAYQWYKAHGQYPPEYQYTVTDITQYTSDWERTGKTGDIMTLADKEWAKNNINDGVFTVSTVEELASAVYYINAFQDIRNLQPINSSMDLEGIANLEKIGIVLENDIDLAGYDWAPITVYNGELNGNGHTIRNVTMPSASSYMGFILQAQNADIHDVTFENVSVKITSASGAAGIVAAKQELPYRPTFENVHVSGTISVPERGKYGGILGSGEGTFTNCTANVSVNDTVCTYLSSKERETQSQIDNGEELVTLTLDLDTKMLTRTTDDSISSYGLVIIRDGEKILERGFTDSDTLDMTVIEKYTLEKGSYQMYINSYRNGGYQRISKIISYEITD